VCRGLGGDVGISGDDGEVKGWRGRRREGRERLGDGWYGVEE
jgi:hypothetical protein